MRTTRETRSMVRTSVLALVCSAGMVPWMPALAPAAVAQSGATARSVKFVTTGANADVPLRSGNYTVFYPVARLKAGQVLAVVNDEDPEWLEVAYPAQTPAVVFTTECELRERDGKKIVVTTKRSSLSAFNIAASGRSDHYKRVFRSQALPAGTELRYVGPLTDPQTGEVFAYKVEAPMDATGFVAKSSVRDASAGDAQAYLASLGLTVSQLNERLGLAAAVAQTPTTPSNSNANPTTITGGETPVTVTNADGAGAGGEHAIEGGATPTVTMGGLEGEGVIAARLDTPPPAPKWTNVDAVKTLDASYDAVSAEPLESAEFAPLIEEYRTLLAEVPEDDTTRSVREYINARIALLELRRDLQTTLSDLRSLEASHESAKSHLETAALKSQSGVEYSLAGRLERSALYDGERLPLRYRLELIGEQGVRTLLAYVEPPKDQALDTLIGRDVTVIAKDRIDPKSGFNVVHARKVSETAAN